MGLFSRARRQSAEARQTAVTEAQLVDHLDQFVETRRGVEAWIEQPTSFNKPSILLVAFDGESTRRALPSVEFGYEYAAARDLPAYDAGVVPYPRRMREYGAAQRRRAREQG